MAVPFSNTKLRVPKGFQNILECLAREVLRSQPDNIHEFAAAYFENMMKVRAETGHDPAVHGAKLEDRNYNNEAFKKRTVDPGDPEQNSAALRIQTQFRQHSAKEEVKTMREEDAAVRIQAGFRGYLDREQVRSLKDGEEGGQTAEQEEEVDIDLNDPEVEKAAIKIQAGFKGFKARKDVHGQEGGESQQEKPEEQPAAAEEAAPPSQQPEEQQQQTTQEEEEVDIDLEDPATEKAALKIQAGFRGYQTRKDLKQPGEGAEEQSTEQQQGEGEQTTEQQETAPSTEQAPAEAQESQAPAESGEASETKAPEGGEEEIDIDLNDPEVEKAATKIQAGFKGMKARKSLQEKTSEAGDETESKPEEQEAEETQGGVNEEEAEAAPATTEAAADDQADGGEVKPEAVEEGETQAEESAPPAEAAAAEEAEAVPQAPAEEEGEAPAEETGAE